MSTFRAFSQPWHFHHAWMLAALLCGSLARADAIAWVGTDFPPMAMSQGEYAKQGYIDALFRHVQTSLSQHSFHEEIVPWPRAMNMARNGGPYCLISAFQTPERDAFLRFTAPYGHVYPIGMVIRASDRKRFANYLTKEGEFQLGQALQVGELRMGIAGSRSYGPKIDGLVQPLIQAKAAHIQQSHQDESTKFLLTMLQNNRFDFMLAYPSEVVFYGGAGDALHFYPIAGNSELLPGRFSCTKSPQTDRVFEEVSKLVASPKTHAAFMNSYERWLPQYLIKPYRQRLAALPKHP